MYEVLFVKNLSFRLNTYMEFNTKVCLFYYPKIPLSEQFCLPIISDMAGSTVYVFKVDIKSVYGNIKAVKCVLKHFIYYFC